MSFIEQSSDKVIPLPLQSDANAHPSGSSDHIDDFIVSLEGKVEAELAQPFDHHASPLIVEANLSAWHQRKIMRGAFEAGAIPFPATEAERNETAEST